MSFINIVKDVIEDDAIENLCKKSKAFAAFNKIHETLVKMAENKIIQLQTKVSSVCWI